MIALFLLALQFTDSSTGFVLTPRVELLATWIQAADAHAPNTTDAPLQVVRALSSQDIATSCRTCGPFSSWFVSPAPPCPKCRGRGREQGV